MGLVTIFFAVVFFPISIPYYLTRRRRTPVLEYNMGHGHGGLL
jgi:hypothetical protein